MDIERKQMDLEKMRLERGIWQVAYKTFTENYVKYPGYVFCFYEGEDRKYYNPRIARYCGSEFYTIVAKHKQAVLGVMNRIKNDPLYKNINTMFFIDRDFDISHAVKNKDLFETPCYSIENLYANEETFSNILRSEFGFNFHDSEYTRCMERYHMLSTQYNELTYRFNALMLCQLRYAPGAKGDFEGIKVNDIADITIETVRKSNKFDQIVSERLKRFGVSMDQLSQIEKELRAQKKPEIILRGKNQLDFLCNFTNLLCIENKNTKKGEPGFFTEKTASVSINITNNRLSELSQYAQTPIELITFLLAHRPKESA